jgi:biopolymer transport protein ExbD
MIRLPKLVVAMAAVAFVLALALPVLADEIKGTVKLVTPDKNELVVTDQNQKDMTVQVKPDCKIFHGDKEAKLADLQAGEEVTITCQKEGEKLVASEIRCKKK